MEGLTRADITRLCTLGKRYFKLYTNTHLPNVQCVLGEVLGERAEGQVTRFTIILQCAKCYDDFRCKSLTRAGQMNKLFKTR